MRISSRPAISESITTVLKASKNLLHRYGWDILVVLAMGVLLYQGLFGQIYSDVPIYQCFAVAFWGGLPALKTLPWGQCLFLTQAYASPISPAALVAQLQAYHLPAPLIQLLVQLAANQPLSQPLHVLPWYPLPSIIPFILPLIAPPYLYEVAYAILMVLVAAGIYMLLRHFRSRWAALVFALYLVIGGWATAAGRFDLVPSALTLVAILFGVRQRWNWAFAFLALATFFKLYPLVLLLPFLLAQQRASAEKWLCWRRWTPLAVFAAVCLGVLAVSLFLSVQGTLGAYSGGSRTVQAEIFQVETPGASVLWLLSFLGYPLQSVSTYGSFNVTGPLVSQVSLIDTVLLGAGLLYTWWLQWRGKVDLAASCLLTLLIVLFTAKVFSPQYLIWVIPLAAYVGESDPNWVGAWCLLGGLTTLIFPYLYMSYFTSAFEDVSSAPLFFAVIAIRNLFLFGMIVTLLVSYTRNHLYKASTTVEMQDLPVTPIEEAPVGEMEDLPVTVIEPSMEEEEEEETFHTHQSEEKPINVRRGEGGVEGMGGPLLDTVPRTASIKGPPIRTSAALALTDHPTSDRSPGLRLTPMGEQEEPPIPEDSHQPLLLWHKLALGTVLAISAFLNFFALNQQDFFEYYFGAAVKSMLMSWHNFFFVSFDPAGFEAIDKPPLGFWMQALSAKLLGFSRFSLLLPEALAGVLAVALLFYLVRRVFGPVAGLLAALMLALSPISVITNRNNIVDSLLVLTVLLAAWAVSKAAETGRFRWLCLCAVLIGLGFNIKFFQAYLVVPAFGLLYLLGAPLRWRTKFVQLVLAVGIVLVVSLSWATIVDLTPASQRPAIGSSPTNSELDLAFGYNGTFRLTADSSIVDNQAWEIGTPGITRFLQQPVGGQSSWLLPLALLSLLALGWHRGWRLPLTRRQQALVLWGGWLLPMLILFSNAHFFHLYYLSLLAPATAALVGAGVVTLWQNYIRPGWRGWLLPYALLLTGVLQIYLLSPFPQWSSMLMPFIIGSCIIIELVLLLLRWRLSQPLQRVAVTLTALGLLSLLLAPTVWAALPLSRAGRAFPMAGPPVPKAQLSATLADPVLERYLLARKGHTQFLLATMNTEAAAPFILDTGQPVLAFGGYSGADDLLTVDHLIQRVDHGTVRFFLLPSDYVNYPVISWVTTHCREVPPAQWQSSYINSFSVDAWQLYDCAHHT